MNYHIMVHEFMLLGIKLNKQETLSKFGFKYICMKLTLYFYINRLIDEMSSNISLRSIFNANKLTGLNFLDWYHNLKIILK
jgi:hypothetical protein